MTMSNEQPEQSDVAARRTPGPDEAAHLDNLLMQELTKVNYQLTQYVLRFLDADAKRVPPIPVADELALASLLTTAAHAVRARAERRSPGSAGSSTVEGDSR
jgi:hypothetical protein